MAEVQTDPKLSTPARCSARAITTAATFIAAAGAGVMGISRGSSALHGGAQTVLVALLIGVPLVTAIAWFASRLRYGVVMVVCAVVGVIPWTGDWWKGDGRHVGGYGLALVTMGVLITSFISANSRPTLRAAWEQCAPASAAAAGWLLALTALLTAFVDGWRWFGPLPLVFGAVLFVTLSVVSAVQVRQRVSRGAVPSTYLEGRSLAAVLLLKFLGGAGYVIVAILISIPSATFIWMMTGGSTYQRSATEAFSKDGTKRIPTREK